MSDLSKAIDETLKSRQMTRAALADQMGWSRANISRLLNGGQRGTLDSWVRVLDHLGLELNVQPKKSA